MIRIIRISLAIVTLIFAFASLSLFLESRDIVDLVLTLFFGFIGYLFFPKKKNTRISITQEVNLNQGKTESAPSISSIVTEDKKNQQLNITYSKTPLFKDFVVLDFETTGLSPSNDKIIEIGLVKYKDGVAIDSFGTLINPKRRIPIEASRVNNITDSMVKNMPTIADVHDKFIEFIKDETLVAHNAPFDIGFMINNFNINSDSLTVFDTLTYCRKNYNFKNNKLGTVAKALKIEIEPTHRSTTDCLTTGEIYLKIRDHYEKNEIVPAAAAYEKEGNIDKAIELYEKAISNNYHGHKPYEKLAIYYKKQKDTENEIRVLNKAIYVYGNLIPDTEANRDVKLEKFKTQLNKILS